MRKGDCVAVEGEKKRAIFNSKFSVTSNITVVSESMVCNKDMIIRSTLVDSMPTFISALLTISDENRSSHDNDIIKTIMPFGINGTAEHYTTTIGINKSKEENTGSMKSYMMEIYYNTIPAKENVIFVLTELKNSVDGLNVLTASLHIT